MIFLRDDRGRWLIHLRRSDKQTYPDLCGIGAGGRIEQNETPADGAARELWEETGLRVPLTAVTDFPFEDGAVRHHAYIFTATADTPITNHDAEWQHIAWVSAAEVDALAAAGRLCPDTALGWARARPDRPRGA
jgi:8-oxo-dGTP pyrophosphatase MutT (NUDIX family)